MIEKYIDSLKKYFGNRKPEFLMILGSGLGDLAEQLEDKEYIPYEKLGFPESHVVGHAGRLVLGKMGGKEVVCMQGRFHLYEGYEPAVIKDVISAFASVGVQKLIVTNAAGSLSTEMPAGSLMMITDHINFSGRNPLVGQNDEKQGPRFPDMSEAYNLGMRDKFRQIAEREKINIFEGVYLMVLGPNFETAAEIRAFKTLGADAVGMSTVPEVIAAVYAGLQVLGVSVITNLGTGLKKSVQSHDETLEQAQNATKNLSKILKSFIQEV